MADQVIEHINLSDFDVNKISLTDKNKISVNTFSKQKEHTVLLDYDGIDTTKTKGIIFSSPNFEVKFATPYNGKSISLALGEYKDTTDTSFAMTSSVNFIKKFSESLAETIIGPIKNNLNKYFDIPDNFDEDVLKDIFKSPVNQTEGFEPLLNTKLWLNENTNNLFIDKNNVKMDITDPLDVLKRGTRVRLFLKMSRIKITDTSIQVPVEIVGLKIISVGNGSSSSTLIDISNYDIQKYSMGKVETTAHGGKKTTIKYDGNIVSFKLPEVGFAPYDVKNINEESGSVSYAVNVNLTNQDQDTFIKDTNQYILDNLIKDSKDYYGKKKPAKSIQGIYTDIRYYTKKVREAMSKGEDPQYPPTLKVNLPYYEDKNGFGFKTYTVDLDTGEKTLYDGDIVEMIENNGRNGNYEITARIQHIWIGAKTSVKFVCTELISYKPKKVTSSLLFNDESHDVVEGCNESDGGGSAIDSEEPDDSD
jgi:hypothetical protein